VGLADASALGVAVDAFRALEVIGLPEAEYALSHAAIYLALAPKSNSIGMAMRASREVVEATPAAEVPDHLRSAATEGERGFGFGVGYVYPHDHAGIATPQQYLPDAAVDAILYRPRPSGNESTLAERLAAIDDALGKGKR
jgi:putative ATPase